MKSVEKIINRLNKGFGFDIPLDAPYHHHGGRGLFAGGWSWAVSKASHDVGSIYPMSECLKWKRWIYDRGLQEIYEYIPSREEDYKKNPDILIEKQ